MSMPTKPLVDWTPDELFAFSDQGKTIYDERLKTILEPEHNGEIVAIDVETGEYAVGKTSLEVSRRLRERHPQALFLFMDIGPAKDSPTTDKVIAAGAAARRQK